MCISKLIVIHSVMIYARLKYYFFSRLAIAKPFLTYQHPRTFNHYKKIFYIKPNQLPIITNNIIWIPSISTIPVFNYISIHIVTPASSNTPYTRIQTAHHLGMYRHRFAIETVTPWVSSPLCSSWYPSRIYNNAFCRANVRWKMWLWLGIWIVEDHRQ